MKNIIRRILIICSLFIFVSSCTQFYLGLLDFVGNKVLNNKDEAYENYIKNSTPEKEILLSESKEYNLISREVEGVKYYLYRKNLSDNLIIYVHGGAFVRIRVHQDYIKMMQDIKDKSKSNYDIVFINYKGEKFPSQTYELETVLNSLISRYKKVILMGDSSGGNVILSNTIYRRNIGEKKVSAIILMSPWSDPSNRVKSRFTNYSKDILMGKSMYNQLLLYNPYVEGNDLENPLLSPVYGEFSNFPPTLIQYGSIEILADDSKIVCNKIKASGSYCKLEEYDGMPHVFQLYQMLDKSSDARKSAVEFIDSIFLKK